MLKAIALLSVLSTSTFAFQLPNYDFNMAENAVKRSKSVKAQAAELDGSIVDVDKVAKKTYMVSLDNGCSFEANFVRRGFRSTVNVDADTVSCN